MAGSEKPDLYGGLTGSMVSTDPDMSTSINDLNVGDAMQKKMAVLEESSFGLSEFLEDDEEDDTDAEGMGWHNSALSSHTTSAVLELARIPRRILASKMAVSLILVTSTCLLGYYTYIYTNEEQTNDFVEEFEDYADEIVDQSKNNAVNTFLVLSSFSKTVTSLALFANSSWPLLMIPHFERRASDFLYISNAQQVALAPLVSDNHREDWEAYTVANQDWIQEGIDFEYLAASTAPSMLKDNDEEEQLAPGEANVEGDIVLGRALPIQDTIWRSAPLTGGAVVEQTRGPHMPIWQTYPAPRSSFVVNYNLLSNPAWEKLRKVAVRDRQAVLSGVVDNFILFGSARSTDLNPRSVILQPVFKAFEEDAPVVAFLVVIVSWDMVFKNVLHAAAKPIVCVLSNACGQIFSYEVIGKEVNYLGSGDRHDEHYDKFAVSSDFGFSKDASLLTSMCNFTLTVYPTQSMEEASRNKMPIYITLAVISMFAFTTIIFLLYDLMVQRQQSTLAATAMKTTAILGSLFPQEVHDRLFASPLAENDKANSAPKFRMRNMITDDGKNKGRGDGNGEKKAKKDAPIADLFPECTVLFCDISGFTAWSSVREPTQVFQLLETVYNAFDAIANRRGVFKVETIGDSYLAVTGLPSPRDDHAVAMVRFAHDCLTKMNEVTQTLELELGPGTGDLTMRFGLHSGPVTAGVLRGEKTRFQLFGDTVNTASRMESTGERDKIQVSQETADLLTAAGKERWLKPRDEKIMAKGKGELQTYWANPRLFQSQESFMLSNSSSHALGGGGRPQLTSNSNMVSSRLLHATIAAASGLDDRKQRSVHWISEIMLKILKQIAARRATTGWNAHMPNIPGKAIIQNIPGKHIIQNIPGQTKHIIQNIPGQTKNIIQNIPGANMVHLPNMPGKKSRRKSEALKSSDAFKMESESSEPQQESPLQEEPPLVADEPGLVVDELKDIITLPRFDKSQARKQTDLSKLKLPAEALEQLHSYISWVALTYQDNPFHNIDHAAHVTMSVSKLLARIVAPETLDPAKESGRTFEARRHDHTYGITSDPLTQFACVFAALIHDADHPGCPNASLVKEETDLAKKYQNRSVAEQNSFDLCWDMLMDDKYAALRGCIYADEDEAKRFRQLVVNSIIATDISDKTLSAQRKARWNKAFHENSESFQDESSKTEGELAIEAINRKATIVIEHLIQASDVAHTMQHWHIYIKWNEKLFEEMQKAYLNGHLEKPPAESWYQGELGFYDFYIIPLAKKLKECGVFGVSCAEYLNYANANRKEWEVRGKEIVAGYVKKYAKPSLGARPGAKKVGSVRGGGSFFSK